MPRQSLQQSAEPVNEDSIEDVEKETIERANQALSALEVAIAKWDLTPKKPDYLEEKFERYKKLHDVLSDWEKQMLLAMGKKENLARRLIRLQEFVRICQYYA
jgi:hypothetical protein